MNFINIEIEQGNSYLLELTYTDDVTGLPKDLTNYTARLAVNPYSGLPPAILLTEANTKIVLGGVTGDIKAYFSPSDTLAVDWTQAPFDLMLTDPLAVKVKIVKGLLTISPSESV